MKKLFYFALILATAVGFTSCDEKEDDVPQEETGVDSYIGTLAVSNYSDDSIYTKSNVTFDFDDDTNTLTMWGVSFSEAMAAYVSVDIIIANVPEISDDIYSIDTITATLEDGSPAPDFISDLTDVTITESDDALAAVFSVDVTMYGTTTTYNVSYAGIEVE